MMKNLRINILQYSFIFGIFFCWHLKYYFKKNVTFKHFYFSKDLKKKKKNQFLIAYWVINVFI